MLAIAAQIVSCLILAALIGFVAGWLIRGLRSPRPVVGSTPPTQTPSPSSAAPDAKPARERTNDAQRPHASGPLIERAHTMTGFPRDGPENPSLEAGRSDPGLGAIKTEIEGIKTTLRTLAQSREHEASSVTASVGDDLRLLPGVGPALAQTLSELGVRSYRQIANWSTEDIASIAARLGSAGSRVARDDWVQTAKDLHFVKHGERL